MKNKDNIEIYTKEWCPYCRRAKAMLDSLGLDYQEHDVTDEDEMYEEMVDRSNKETVPQIFINGDHLGGYDDLIDNLTSGKLDEIIEINRPNCEKKSWDLTIVGAGPAGMTAAVYAIRKGLEVLLLTRDIGGQVLETDTIDNYLPEYGINGPDLMQGFLDHVREYKVDKLFGEEVKELKNEGENKIIMTRSGKKINTRAAIITTGSKKRHLLIPGENELKGKGVSYCATCDGFIYEGKPVVIVGGGNSGLEAALDMAKLDSKVYLVEFSENLSGDDYLREKVKQSDKIEVLTSFEITEIKGQDEVNGAIIKNLNTDKVRNLDVKAVFVEIGLIPNTGFICDDLELNERDEIVIDENNQTSLEGVYAAGDVTDIKDKQIVISAAEGAKAALRVNEYLS